MYLESDALKLAVGAAPLKSMRAFAPVTTAPVPEPSIDVPPLTTNLEIVPFVASAFTQAPEATAIVNPARLTVESAPVGNVVVPIGLKLRLSVNNTPARVV